MFYSGFTADSDKDKADLFAKFFSSAYNKSSSFKFPGDLSADIPLLKEIGIETKEVWQIWKSLNVNKSKGPDELPIFC